MSRVNASLSGMVFEIETLVDLDISVGMVGSDECMLMLQSWLYIWVRECQTFEIFLQCKHFVDLCMCV